MDRKEISAGLRELGLKNGSVVMLHSSYLSLGEVIGGPSAVIHAFLDVIGKKGTLLVPAFASLGVLVEEVKNLPGAIISTCPVGAVAAYGPAAEELCKDHWKAETAHGIHTPFTRLAEKKGIICLLGVDQDRNTTLHSIEALLELPYLQPISCTVKTASGKEVKKEYKYFPGPHRDFIGIDALLRDSGAMKVGRIGNAQVRMIDSVSMFDILMTTGEECPDLFLCSNPNCADCVKQRAAIYAHEMAQESFKLTVSSRLAGRYIPEMVENMKKQGINLVELDYLQGKLFAKLSAKKLQEAVQEFKDEKIEVSGIRLPCVPDEPEKLAEKLLQSGINRVIMPLSGSTESVKILKKNRLDVVLYNVAQSSKSAAQEFSDLLKNTPELLFCFNAANFAKVGENPFLYSYQAGRFIKTTGQLDVADCTWDGNGTELALGNAEIKEMISIMRCRNFSGYFCLGGGAFYPGDLESAAGNFRQMMKNI